MGLEGATLIPCSRRPHIAREAEALSLSLFALCLFLACSFSLSLCQLSLQVWNMESGWRRRFCQVSLSHPRELQCPRNPGFQKMKMHTWPSMTDIAHLVPCCENPHLIRCPAGIGRSFTACKQAISCQRANHSVNACRDRGHAPKAATTTC